ncbi:gap junction alpha-3 protein-like [Archocentrus centrarchus]|uniref:gap junction alpha-3 protein-like n=1 Tax=Archocentrus centrarchus TaxID=63155 RepID=UPI0011EA2850|nr:gap junction alpha-3 protein-like [Archocentrus centrarchus]XP_030603533.1 gap junction alpha-3 protein-like [Archocentrus centrarchus]
MMSQKLGFLSSVLCKWHAQATLIGKSVLPVLLLIRLVILGAAVHTVWSDDEETFKSYALQPGCQTACFDACTPLSLPRLWTIQLVLVLAPGLVFLCYLIHLTNQETQVQKGNGEVKGHTLTVYLACTVFVILVEVGCNVVQWLLYGFQLSTKFTCVRNPCLHTADCFVPHAREKTILLHIMLTTSSLSILLNAVEAVCAKLRRPDGGKTLRSASVVEESILSRLLALWHSHAGFLGKTVLPVLQLVRLVLVGAAVQPVWSNDLRDFVCNTKQSACKIAAYNVVFPFTLNQYWTLQVALVLAPGLIYFSYLVHLLMTEKQSGTGTVAKGQNLRGYLGLLSAVALLEVGFAVGQPLIFGLSLPASVYVGVHPCLSMVDCHVSQSMEKSVFMFIMLVLACVSGLLTLVEMCTVLKTERPQMKHQDNMNRESCYEEKEAGTEKDDACMKLNI